MFNVIKSNESFNCIARIEGRWWEQYKNYSMPKIFLAGPSPRSEEVDSWRPEAVDMLRDFGFKGLVFVPEPFSGTYEGQIQWEWNALHYSTVRLFWVPRDLKTMPALTTNVEFGVFIASKDTGDGDRCIYGRPEGAPNTSYLDWHYRRVTGNEPYDNLKSLLIGAIDKANFVEEKRKIEAEK